MGINLHAYKLFAFVTSAYSSHSGCRAYLEDIERARSELGATAPRIEKIRAFWNHPGFIEPFAASTRAALATLPAHLRDDAFQNYVVDRFRGPRGDERIYLRPQVPFGAPTILTLREGGYSLRWSN